MCSYYYFSRHYQIAVKIKPLYLTHYTYYLTYNTTRVVQRHYIFMLIRTEQFKQYNWYIYQYFMLTMGSRNTKPVRMVTGKQTVDSPPRPLFPTDIKV